MQFVLLVDHNIYKNAKTVKQKTPNFFMYNFITALLRQACKILPIICGKISGSVWKISCFRGLPVLLFLKDKTY